MEPPGYCSSVSYSLPSSEDEEDSDVDHAIQFFASAPPSTPLKTRPDLAQRVKMPKVEVRVDICHCQKVIYQHLHVGNLDMSLDERDTEEKDEIELITVEQQREEIRSLKSGLQVQQQETESLKQTVQQLNETVQQLNETAQQFLSQSYNK